MTLYHGTSVKFTADKNRCLYLTPDINVAKEFALGLDGEGNHNEHSYIYATDIDDNTVTEVEDFDYFDSMGYQDYDNMPEVAHNANADWYCVKHPKDLRLVEEYENIV